MVELFHAILIYLVPQGKFEPIYLTMLKTMVNIASQNNRFRGIFLSQVQTDQGKKVTLLKLLSDKLFAESLQGSTMRLKTMFTLFRTLGASAEVCKEMMKYKVIETLLENLVPVCKNEKDIKLMKHYLTHFCGYLAGFARTEEGISTVNKMKQVFDFSFFLLDTVQPATLGNDSILGDLVCYNLLFLRNCTAVKTSKIQIISNAKFMPCLFAFLSAKQYPVKIKAYTAAFLWELLHRNHNVKAAMNKEAVRNEIKLMR